MSSTFDITQDVKSMKMGVDLVTDSNIHVRGQIIKVCVYMVYE